eukprot:CAMPEP_0176420250 /NCGR_PEP_ID=MMETSP0127-20121128/8504_1 /TAXON_ID=938130 /ORGANISM="Platyophrya macrostoma, Strain WH" /LENGTH=216 /DNA_ID=CAMNT_0017800829 /DNA_START=32 /DNA_END=682 /DNA_ORIENTATION=+
MTKSSRSKWKKQNRRERAKDEVGNVQARLVKLNKKLHLCVKGGISKVPSQDPETRFHFTQPEKRKSGERLVLSAPSTNMHGKSDAEAPHPVTVNFETVPVEAPVAGCAFTVEDQHRLDAAEQFRLAASDMLEHPDWSNDEPVEFVIGCNDDEHLTTSFLQTAGKRASAKKEDTAAPKATKLKSMETQRGMTKGDKKIKPDMPVKRLVSGAGASKKK